MFVSVLAVIGAVAVVAAAMVAVEYLFLLAGYPDVWDRGNEEDL